MAHPSRTPPPAPARSNRTRDLVESLLERRIRLTLRKMCQVVSVLTFSAAAFSTVRGLLGQLTGAWGTIILSTLFGTWCMCIVGVIDRGKPRETYRAMLWPIFLGPSLMLASAALHRTDGVASVFNGAVTFAYFLCVIFSAALFDRRFTLKVTAVSLVSYLAIYGLLARTGLHRIAAHVAPLDAIFAERIGSDSSYVTRALVMAAAGFLMAALIGVAYDVVIEVSSVIAEFGTVIDPRVRDLMLAGEVGDGGEERDATVLFADIRGFTSFAEKWEPAPLLRLMKDYFDLMGDPIRREDGTIIEYIGDEILTLFGAPERHPDHAARAGRAALAMQQVLAAQRPQWEAQGYPRIEIGIGLNAGPMLVGRIGSSERQKYGALGDNVNLGSRLQGLTRDYGVPIIVSDAWVERAGDGFVLRELDQVVVKGRQGAVIIYALVGVATDDAATRRASLHERWDAARAAFQAGHTSAAREAAQACLEIDPDDGPARRLLRLLSEAASR